MPSIKKIVRFLDEYLKTDDIKDASWNGLQFEGKRNVTKAAFAVDACTEAFEEVLGQSADLLIVHHGHFWDFHNPSIKGWAKERMKILFEHDISLYCSHLPLDRHRVIGHNAQLLKLLGANITDEFLLSHGKNVGWSGKCEKALQLKDIEEKLNEELNTLCRVLPFGKKTVRTIAVCSGGGSYSGFIRRLMPGSIYTLRGTRSRYTTPPGMRALT